MRIPVNEQHQPQDAAVEEGAVLVVPDVAAGVNPLARRIVPSSNNKSCS